MFPLKNDTAAVNVVLPCNYGDIMGMGTNSTNTVVDNKFAVLPQYTCRPVDGTSMNEECEAVKTTLSRSCNRGLTAKSAQWDF